MHVLAARVGTIDATGGVRGVPLVDGRVELNARVRAFPRRRGDLSPQIAGPHGAHDRTVDDGTQRPL